MPELPEVEIVVRRLDAAISGAEVESALAPGMVTMKTVQPPLDSVAGRVVTGVRRLGKMPVVDFGDLSLLVHLMSAGRLQLFDERASLRDRRSRLLIRLADGRELRLREFGTQQRAWAKLLTPGDLAADEQQWQDCTVLAFPIGLGLQELVNGWEIYRAELTALNQPQRRRR